MIVFNSHLTGIPPAKSGNGPGPYMIPPDTHCIQHMAQVGFCRDSAPPDTRTLGRDQITRPCGRNLHRCLIDAAFAFGLESRRRLGRNGAQNNGLQNSGGGELNRRRAPSPGAFKTGVQAAFPKSAGGGRPGRTCAAPLGLLPRPRRCGPSPAWTAPPGMCRPRLDAPAPPERRA